jgi:hypothetical protein
MTCWIRFLADYAVLLMTLVAAGLVLFFAAPPARPRLVLHPVTCRACSASPPPAAVAATDAYLARIGAIEIDAQK